MSDCQENKALIKGVETSYRIVGQGRPVLVLHGWGVSSDPWQTVQNILSEQGFKVICPDLPGFGKSKTPESAWCLDDYLAWLIEFIDFLKLEKPIIIGHSFGGRVAIKLSVGYPERVEKLILCGTAGIKPELTVKQKLILGTAKAGNFFFSNKFFKNAARKVFYTFLSHKDYVKANPTMKEVIKKVLAEDLLPLLPQINADTLLIWGEKDRMVPLKYGRIMEKEIKNVKLKIILGAGHSPYKEVPEKTANIISEFL